MSYKGNSSHDSITNSARISLITEDFLKRDYSSVSITSSTSQDEFFLSPDHADTTLRRMQHYLDTKQLCDVILVAGIDGKK